MTNVKWDYFHSPVKNQPIMSIVENELRVKNLRIKKMLGNGMCQYESIAYLLTSIEDFTVTPETALNIAIYELETNSEDYFRFADDLLENEDWKDYCNRLKKPSDPSNWGNWLTLRAFCVAVGCSILVYGMGTGNKLTEYVYPDDSNERVLSINNKPCGLFYNGHNHFDVVVPLEGIFVTWMSNIGTIKTDPEFESPTTEEVSPRDPEFEHAIEKASPSPRDPSSNHAWTGLDVNKVNYYHSLSRNWIIFLYILKKISATLMVLSATLLILSTTLLILSTTLLMLKSR